ncbi:glycosyltransferase family 4 protein [Pseudokineococcus sp. 1T1Z-3]|uniref:glycosyltransferase family 4 protein n=1 Tax=Pseudokineococcus sp. 1T1Z-3 TaxID=3132745 RepID=UPI0030B35227
MTPTPRLLRLVVPGESGAPTGGTLYDRRLAAALEALGVDVRVVPVDGDWPEGTPEDRRRLAEVLAEGAEPVLVDGLVGAGAPDAVEAAVAAGAVVHLLQHLPLHLETGLAPERAAHLAALEARTLAAVAGVVVTSRWAAEQLQGVGTPVVAEPGTDPAAPAHGSSPPFLLHLASVTPRKAQDVVVAALAQVADLPWTAGLVGDDQRDPAYAATVRAAVTAAGLEDRVAVTGPLAGAALDAVRDAADLALLPSHVEPWGMAAAESLARGVPAVVGAGTGAVEVLGDGPGQRPGAVVTPGDAGSLAAALRTLLTDAGEDGSALHEARAAARRRAVELPGWDHAARRVAEALGVSV